MGKLSEQRTAVLEEIYKKTGGRANVLVKLDDLYPLGVSHQDDIVNALHSLEARGYIELVGAFEVKILRVKLTQQGVIVAEEGEPTANTGLTINIGNNSNVQVGDHNTQSVNIGISTEHVQTIVGALRADGKAQLADEVQDEVLQAKQPGKLMEFMGKLITAAATAGTTSATTQALIQLFP